MSRTEQPTERTLSPVIAGLLRCPICRANLQRRADSFRCIASNCAAVFPIIRGVPVLLNEQRSLFRISEIVDDPGGRTAGGAPTAWVQHFLPTISLNVAARRNFRLMSILLHHLPATPRVLVVGAGTLGEGFGPLRRNCSSAPCLPMLPLVPESASYAMHTISHLTMDLLTASLHKLYLSTLWIRNDA